MDGLKRPAMCDKSDWCLKWVAYPFKASGGVETFSPVGRHTVPFVADLIPKQYTVVQYFLFLYRLIVLYCMVFICPCHELLFCWSVLFIKNCVLFPFWRVEECQRYVTLLYLDQSDDTSRYRKWLARTQQKITGMVSIWFEFRRGEKSTETLLIERHRVVIGSSVSDIWCQKCINIWTASPELSMKWLHLCDERTSRERLYVNIELNLRY